MMTYSTPELNTNQKNIESNKGVQEVSLSGDESALIYESPNVLMSHECPDGFKHYQH